jgi:hypothetical protein
MSKKAKQTNDFIPDEAVNSGAARYMKMETGENKFRAISKPIIGWEEWIDQKPVRTQIDDEPEATDPDSPPKKFMALVVWNYDTESIQILQLTQQSVIKAIKALAANPDWGSPFTYDINVKKSGEGLKTKYVVTPSPKKPTSKDIIRAANQAPCNLDAMFEGEDPWTVDGDSTEYFFK